MSDKIKRWQSHGAGVYRDVWSGHFYERPQLNGRRTWRRLKGHTLKLAREELSARRVDEARSNYGMAKSPYAPKAGTVGQILAAYEKAGCPDRRGKRKSEIQLYKEQSRLKFLREWWGNRAADNVRPRDCNQYYASRGKGRAVDMELTTLSGAFNWAVASGRMEMNPIVRRPRFQHSSEVRHCREVMPRDAEELHALAAALFEDRKSEAFGWQLLLEAMTGCRTSEILKLRWDAKHSGHAGFIEGDWLWLARSKGGVNPFCLIHPALRETLEQMAAWSEREFPDNPYFIPSFRCKGKAVISTSLTHALKRVGPLICGEGEHRTSHGLRAYYVTVRRSQGASDSQIAAEIGDKSGAGIITSTYGAVPPNWKGLPGLGWLPTKHEPAWAVLEPITKKEVDIPKRLRIVGA